MSFEKLTSPARISFYYTIQELLDLNSLWTLYKSAYMTDEKGEAMIETMAITGDEEDIFLSILEDGVFDILNRFLKYTTGITNAIQFNENYTPSGGVAAKSVVLQVVDHDNYNDNYPKSVADILEKTLKFYVLSEWFSLKNMDNDATKAAQMYAQSLMQLFRHSFQLKKPTIVF